MKPDPPPWYSGLFDHLLQDSRDDFDLVVMKLHRFGKFRDLLDQLTGRRHQATESDKRSHDLDIHLDCSRRVERARKHGDTLFGEHPGQFSPSAVRGT